MAFLWRALASMGMLLMAACGTFEAETMEGAQCKQECSMNMHRTGIQYHNGLMLLGILRAGNQFEQSVVQANGCIYIYEAIDGV